MIKKVFILGLPGSGKSEAARHIDQFFQEKSAQATGSGWFATHFNDYIILDEMSKNPEESQQFIRYDTGGFDVVNFEAFDTALHRLKERIEDYLKFSGENRDEIFVVEFARNDYRRAFNLLGTLFIQDACFIHLHSDVETCKQRIRDRVEKRGYTDDYPVSNSIFKTYYHSDDGQALPFFLQQDFEVDESQVLLINNNSSLEEAMNSITPFLKRIIGPTSARESSL